MLGKQCIYCDGVIQEVPSNLEPIAREKLKEAGQAPCSCPMVKKSGVNDTEVHWAKRKQSILAICSDARPHTIESHIVPLCADALPDATQVTCMACIAAHGG